MDAEERQVFKEWVINREIREQQNGVIEVLGSVLNVTEVLGVTSSLKVFKPLKPTKVNINIQPGTLGGYINFKTTEGQTIIASHDSFMAGIANRTAYALEEIGLTRDGKLSTELLNKLFTNPKCEILLKGGIQDKNIIKALKTVDKDMNNWFKFTTESVRMPNGDRYKIHGYANRITREVIYGDFNPKTNEPVNGLGLKIKINTNREKELLKDDTPATLFNNFEIKKKKIADKKQEMRKKGIK